MLLNSFADDLCIFRDCLHLRRLETAFPAHLSLLAFVYLDRMLTPVAVPACLCGEWSGTGTFSSQSLVWALKMAWVNCGPEVSLCCMRSASDAGDGKNEVRWVPAKGCPVLAQPLLVLVGIAECSVPSSCLPSGCPATVCWPSGWPFKARWVWGRFNSGLLPWYLSFLYFKGEVSCSSHLAQWDQGGFVSFHHTVVTVSPCCISNSDNVCYGCVYSVWNKSLPRLSSALKSNSKV